MTVDEFEALTFEQAAAYLCRRDEEAGVEPMSVSDMRHVYEQGKRCKIELSVFCLMRQEAKRRAKP